jgi:hypothetical protein
MRHLLGKVWGILATETTVGGQTHRGRGGQEVVVVDVEREQHHPAVDLLGWARVRYV